MEKETEKEGVKVTRKEACSFCGAVNGPPIRGLRGPWHAGEKAAQRILICPDCVRFMAERLQAETLVSILDRITRRDKKKEEEAAK